jgi:deoxycytidine triphosphate deaminase
MIWNDRMIKEWASTGGVTPYDGTLVNPASLDLRLGYTIRRPHPIWDRLSTVDIDQKIKDGTIDTLPKWGDPVTFEVDYLKRFDFALLHSFEFVCIPTVAASVLFLKSSKGRDGMNHSHSGWGDPGFGLSKANANLTVVDKPTPTGAQWTFEIQNIAKWPIKLVAGAPVIQMVMMIMAEEPELDYRFTGRYVYQSGPTPERPEVSR